MLKSIADRYLAGNETDIEEKDILIMVCANDDLDYKETNDGNIFNEAIEPATPFCVKFSSDTLVHINIVREAVEYYKSLQHGSRTLKSMTNCFWFIKIDRNIHKLRLFEQNELLCIDRKNQLNVFLRSITTTYVGKIFIRHCIT